ELRDVLFRRRLRSFISEEDALAFVEALRAGADVRSDPDPQEGLVPNDPEDAYLVALARETGAEYVLSSDRHLVALHPARPPVITPSLLVGELERLRTE